MGSLPRSADSVGAWHHVSTRALSRRPYFEVDEDFLFFCDLLAEAVADGRIEIHAFCLMSNHFHLLVRSLDGRLSDTFRDILSRFTRWFNSRRDRDGPLVKSRFFSRVLEGPADRFIVTRYIDHNPVKAKLVERISDYEHGSAWHYARGIAPMWLETSDVMETVAALSGTSRFGPAAYVEIFDPRPAEELEWAVEQRLEHGSGSGRAFERLITSTENEIAAWLRDAARLADGTDIGCHIAPAQSIVRSIAALKASDPDWECKPNGRPRSGWPILTTGLLTTASRESIRAISDRLDCSRNMVERCRRDHTTLLRIDPVYEARAATILHERLRALMPARYLRTQTLSP